MNPPNKYKQYAENNMSDLKSKRTYEPNTSTKQGMEELKLRITDLSTRNVDVALSAIRKWMENQD